SEAIQSRMERSPVPSSCHGDVFGLALPLRRAPSMTKDWIRVDADLEAVSRGKQVLATAVRERRATPETATVARVLRLWIAITLAACGGGGKHSDTYTKATHAQEQCCENL